jgi:hypothetical protein
VGCSRAGGTGGHWSDECLARLVANWLYVKNSSQPFGLFEPSPCFILDFLSL